MVRQKKNGRKAPNDSAGDFPRHNHPVFRCEKCLFVRAGKKDIGGSRVALAVRDSGPSLLPVHPRCQTLIKSMTNYRYAHPSDETPLKDSINDHSVDALRYFLTSRTAGETKNGRY